jgi:3-oxoacyl-[acyl-carrier protein] reductase
VDLGDGRPEVPLVEVAWEDHLRQLAFFVKSPVLLGCAVLPGMRAKRSGRIIQVPGSREGW